MSRPVPAAEITVVVIAKECLPGRVKTRLSPPLTPQQAAELAAVSLDSTLRTVNCLPVARRILYFDGNSAAAPAAAAGFELQPQSPGGLDERLAALFDRCDGPTLLVGMDTPQLSTAHLEPVLLRWTANLDAWFGPAADGGFWALGLRRPDGDLLRGVSMSQPDTGAQQLQRLLNAGLRVGWLPQLTDVDDIGAAVSVADTIPTSRFSATLRTLLSTPRPERAGLTEIGPTGRGELVLRTAAGARG